MNQHIATIAYVLGIGVLFWLDRDEKPRISKALWVPALWLLINGSRPVSMWFESGPTIEQASDASEGSPFDATVYGVLILAALIVLSRRKDRVAAYLRVNAPILIFFSYCAVSVIWSDYSFVAFKRWIKAAGDFIMVLVVLTDSDPSAAIKYFFKRAAFILLPLSVLFIKYYPDIGRSYNPWTWIPMYCGVTTFKNLLGMTCLVCGLGSIWSLAVAYRDRDMPHRMRHIAAHCIIVFVTIWLLHTADSMTSLSCFAMASTLVFLTFQQQTEMRMRVAKILAATCIAVSLCGLFVDPSTMLSSLGRDPTLTGRTEIWHAVLSIHSNPLIGTGFESFWIGSRLERVWAMTAKGIQEAHDGYLELYLNLGLVGVALLGNIMVFGYRNALAALRTDPHIGRMRLAFFTAGVIYSFTEAGFRMQSPIWTAFLLAVTCVPVAQRNKKGVKVSKWQQAEIEPASEVVGAFRSFS